MTRFNEPFGEGIGMLTDLVHEATPKIVEMTQEVVKGLPTTVRIVKETASAVADFADPFLAVADGLRTIRDWSRAR